MSETVVHPAAARGLPIELRTAHVVGLGHHIPEREIPNAQIAERIGVDDEWIVRRTGIRSRRWAGEGAFPVFSCASARPFEDIRQELAQALVRPVRWRETVLALHDAGARAFVEVGPGKVLARAGKRILPECPVAPLEEVVGV